MTHSVPFSFRLLFLAAIALLTAFAFASPSTTFAGGPAVVTKTADTADGTCDVNDCSLREAIILANASPRAITLPEGTYTLSLDDTVEEQVSATGDLDINAAIAINGAGADTTFIDGADLNRVFHVRSGGVTISGVTIRNGLDGFGSGIFISVGALTLNDSAVIDNTTTVSGSGAGIWNQATLIVNNSTISGNTVPGGNGGGIYNFSIGTATVTNSTISGNSADFGAGGIFNGTPGVTTLTNVTMSGNESTAANSGSAIRKDGSGGSVVLKNTIVDGDSVSNCFGAITSNGNNLDNGNTCGLGNNGISDQDPQLLPLTLNPPGTTMTHALLPSSPAIDAGSSDCPPPETDQRGVDRPLGGECDIGAYESDPRGDTNCDGEIDGDDLIDVLSEVANVGTTADCIENGDVDGIGGITTTDALLVANYWAGVITSFP